MEESKTHYRIQNWSEYNKSLMARGSITFWFSQEIADSWYADVPDGSRGAPDTYSDQAIITCLILKHVYGLTLRQTQGFVTSLINLMGLPIACPYYTQLSRRAKNLDVPLPRSSSITDIVVDSSGLKVYGEGEWKVRQHGISKRRTWRKMQLAINPDNHEIVAAALTSHDVSDGEVLEELLDQIPGHLNSVSGDGAYDTNHCYSAIGKKSARTIVPPRKNAILNGKCPERDQVISRINALGGDDNARKKWKVESGYHRRSLAETAMFRYKTMFGDKLSSRIFETQATEFFIKVLAMNLMTSLGMPRTIAIN